MTRIAWMRTLRPLVAGATTALLLAGTAAAQQVRWEDPAPLGAGQRGSLDLVFDDTQPAGRVELPALDGLTVLGAPSRQSSTSIVNGARSAQPHPVLSGARRARRLDHHSVLRGRDRRRHADRRALTVEVGAATVPGGARGGDDPLSDVVAARLTP